MKYFVVSDVHGFFTLMQNALYAQGFDENNPNHKLIVCGDLMDRGDEAREMQAYILSLLKKDKVILIKGNHEDLMLEMLNVIEARGCGFAFNHRHHITNGTFGTLLQLIEMTPMEFISNPQHAAYLGRETPFVKDIISHMADYFETERYIFVHGWIPCKTQKDMPPHYRYGRTYSYDPNWRSAKTDDWAMARWFNGMQLAHKHKILEPNKTIVCGHWHTSFGHKLVGKIKNEFGADEDFSPFYADGIIALDACTSHSKKINCIVIDD